MYTLGCIFIASYSDGSIRRGNVHMLLLDGVGLLSYYYLLQVPLLEMYGREGRGKGDRGRKERREKRRARQRERERRVKGGRREGKKDKGGREGEREIR